MPQDYRTDDGKIINYLDRVVSMYRYIARASNMVFSGSLLAIFRHFVMRLASFGPCDEHMPTDKYLGTYVGSSEYWQSYYFI